MFYTNAKLCFIMFYFSTAHGNKLILFVCLWLCACNQECVWHARETKKTRTTNVIFLKYWHVNMLSCQSHFTLLVFHSLSLKHEQVLRFISICCGFFCCGASEQINAPPKHPSLLCSRLRCFNEHDVLVTLPHPFPHSPSVFPYVRILTPFAGADGDNVL